MYARSQFHYRVKNLASQLFSAFCEARESSKDPRVPACGTEYRVLRLNEQRM